MIRQVFILILILITSLNAVASSFDSFAPGATPQCFNLLNNAHLFEHQTLISAPFTQDDSLSSNDCGLDGDNSSSDSDEGSSSSHYYTCHCGHFDSIPSKSYKLEAVQAQEYIFYSEEQFSPTWAISDLIRPPQIHLSVLL